MESSASTWEITEQIRDAIRRNDSDAIAEMITKLNTNILQNMYILNTAVEMNSQECISFISEHIMKAEPNKIQLAAFAACRVQHSIKTIEILLHCAPTIVNSIDDAKMSLLHIASKQGRLELIQLLLDNGALLDFKEEDGGNTPLQLALAEGRSDSVEILLHAGANPYEKNYIGYTPLHTACVKGDIKCIQNLILFIDDLNVVNTGFERTALMEAVYEGHEDVVKLLLECGADPNISDKFEQLPIHMAIEYNRGKIFEILLPVTDKEIIHCNLFHYASRIKFNRYIMEVILTSDLGSEYFFCPMNPYRNLEIYEKTCAPLHKHCTYLGSFLDSCGYMLNEYEKIKEYFILLLMRGIPVNSPEPDRCPALTYLIYRGYPLEEFRKIFNMLIEFDCDVDYCSSETCKNEAKCFPDAVRACLVAEPTYLPTILTYCLRREPQEVIEFSKNNFHIIAKRLQPEIEKDLLNRIDINGPEAYEQLKRHVHSLQHLSRLKIRKLLKSNVKTTSHFLRVLQCLPLPKKLQRYLRYDEIKP